MNQFNPYFNPTPQPDTGIKWAQGVEGAKAYQLAPNSNVMLLDSDNEGIFYIKTSDNIGMCNLRVFQYQEITTPPTHTDTNLNEYVRKDELEALLKSYLKLEEHEGGVMDEQSVSTTKQKSFITK